MNKNTQKKGGQLNPPIPPKYNHITVDATLKNAKKLTKEDVQLISNHLARYVRSLEQVK